MCSMLPANTKRRWHQDSHLKTAASLVTNFC
jgi:hypothetical protein